MSKNNSTIICPVCFGVDLLEKKCDTCSNSGFVTYKQLEMFLLERNIFVKNLFVDDKKGEVKNG